MIRIHRQEQHKVIAGVCQGLGEAWRIDPLWLRIAFVALALANGTGVVLYLLAWLLMPSEGATYSGDEDLVRQNAAEIGRRAQSLGMQARDTFAGRRTDDPWSEKPDGTNAMVIGGAALVGVGLLVLMNNLGLFAWLTFGRLLPLALIAIGAVVLLNNLRKA